MAYVFDRYNFNGRLQLGRQELVRPLSFGTNWRSIRIGIRCALTDSQRTAFSPVNSYGWLMGIGVQQGITTSFWADTVTDWIGGGPIGINTVGTTIGIYAAGTPGRYTANTNPNGVHKTGATWTFGTSTSATTAFAGAGVGGVGGTQFMSAHYTDITKGTGSYLIQNYYLSNAQAIINTTDAAFLAAMESTGTPTNTTAANLTGVVYTGAGLFDCVSIIHSRYWPTLEIDALAVSRWA